MPSSRELSFSSAPETELLARKGVRRITDTVTAKLYRRKGGLKFKFHESSKKDVNDVKDLCRADRAGAA
jgi:hypothetical protein